MNVIGDSPRAARYAGMRTRRKILAVMALSGGIAGLGGASQVGDFSHTLDAEPARPAGRDFGYTGIVVAALGRYNPFAVCLVGVLHRRAAERRLPLQGPDFPSGLVGVMQGIILFCALGGELLIRYRVRFDAAAAPRRTAAAGERERSLSVNNSLARRSCSRRPCSTARRSSSRRSESCSPSARACSTSASRG